MSGLLYSKANRILIKDFITASKNMVDEIVYNEGEAVEVVPYNYDDLEKIYPAVKNAALELNLFHGAEIAIPENAETSMLAKTEAYFSLVNQSIAFIDDSKSFTEAGISEDFNPSTTREVVKSLHNVIDSTEDEDARLLLKYRYSRLLSTALCNSSERERLLKEELGETLFQGDEKDFAEKFTQTLRNVTGYQIGEDDAEAMEDILDEAVFSTLEKGKKLDSQTLLAKTLKLIKSDLKLDFDDEKNTPELLACFEEIMPNLTEAKKNIKETRNERRMLEKELNGSYADTPLDDEIVEDILYKSKVLGGEFAPVKELPDEELTAVTEYKTPEDFMELNAERAVWEDYETRKNIIDTDEDRKEFNGHVSLWIDILANERSRGTLDRLATIDERYWEQQEEEDDDDDDFLYMKKPNLPQDTSFSETDEEIKREAVELARDMKSALWASSEFLNITLEKARIDDAVLDRIEASEGFSYKDSKILADFIQNFTMAYHDKIDLFVGFEYPKDGASPNELIDRIAMRDHSLEKWNLLQAMNISMENGQNMREQETEDLTDNILVKLWMMTPKENEELKENLKDAAVVGGFEDLRKIDLGILEAGIKTVVYENCILPTYLQDEGSREQFIADLANMEYFAQFDGETQQFIAGLAADYAVKVQNFHFDRNDGIDEELALDVQERMDREVYLDVGEEALEMVQNNLAGEEDVLGRYLQFKYKENQIFGTREKTSKLLYRLGDPGRN